ncbi:DUF2285 domain-containing protein [Methylocapsa acidiphila]|uniref:DUF2285 domain-containing protein n=1 Tax=Methylocapsa acidiphila TaxID=133552 RepID=UPI0006878027|nr:DUF2285 domain-containing protein [Methylocapsa acidiphila]
MTAPPAQPGVGGCDFLADPNQRADKSPVFWRPDELASVVVLTAAPDGARPTTISLADLSGDVVRRDAEDGAHLIVRQDGTIHQLWAPDPPGNVAPLAAVVPLDASAPQRAEAALRFWRLMAHGRLRTPPTPIRPPIRRADRLVAALRALDGRLDGASYRAIAEALFDPSRIASEPWKTASIRDTVIRLARTGFAMMRGGYRNLLGPRRRE